MEEADALTKSGLPRLS